MTECSGYPRYYHGMGQTPVRVIYPLASVRCLGEKHGRLVSRRYASCTCKPKKLELALLYWSSSPYAGNNNNAWNVNFNDGNVNNNNKNNSNYVRLVRGSES